MLEAFDLTGSLRDAAELAGCSHHTVARHVAARDAGGLTDQPATRPMLIDEFLPELEEWMEHSKGKIRADIAYDKLLALGYAGSERTIRRAVAPGGIQGRPHPGAPAVGDRAEDVVAVRLRGRTGDRRGEDGAVLRVGGLVEVPGGAGVAGQDDAQSVVIPGRTATTRSETYVLTSCQNDSHAGRAG